MYVHRDRRKPMLISDLQTMSSVISDRHVPHMMGRPPEAPNGRPPPHSAISMPNCCSGFRPIRKYSRTAEEIHS